MVEVSPGHGTVPALYLQVPPADRRPTISVMSKPELIDFAAQVLSFHRSRTQQQALE